MSCSVRAPDDVVVRALHADDAVGLDRLMAEYRRGLVRYAEGILGGNATGEDVVQEAFYRLWTHRREVEPGRSLRAYLFTLTRNAAIDELRRNGRQAAVVRHASEPWRAPDPLDVTEASDLAGAADRAAARLPARRRQVFRLGRLKGLTYREIGDAMGLSPQTVANQMSRALRSLREALVDFDVPVPSPDSRVGGGGGRQV